MAPAQRKIIYTEKNKHNERNLKGTQPSSKLDVESSDTRITNILFTLS